ncbi:MAG: hypothetical protein OHK0023_05090 [Anaerolineae bacterium]
MDYGMIGQIAKAKHYAEERHRMKFLSFSAQMVGDNNTHTVTYTGEGHWHCTSDFFNQHGWSSHTRALEQILKDMVTPIPAVTGKPPASQSSMIGQIDKSRKYLTEPQRVKFLNFVVTFNGDNHTHTVKYDGSAWSCTCHFFETHKWCSHVIAVERILSGMVQAPEKASV